MIKFLVMDVDGTLTDGKIYMGSSGEQFKVFDIKDGYGIKEMLPTNNIVPVIITARNSKILTNRCEELEISEIYQGVKNKLDYIKEIIKKYNNDKINYSLKNVAYIGDDILDLPCIVAIGKAGGITACPADGAKQVKEIVDFISSKSGGDGAVREFIEWIINKKM